jgi:hypothetical protein
MNRGRKITGGRYHKRRKKKLYELAGQKTIVKLSDKEKRLFFAIESLSSTAALENTSFIELVFLFKCVALFVNCHFTPLSHV